MEYYEKEEPQRVSIDFGEAVKLGIGIAFGMFLFSLILGVLAVLVFGVTFTSLFSSKTTSSLGVRPATWSVEQRAPATVAQPAPEPDLFVKQWTVESEAKSADKAAILQATKEAESRYQDLISANEKTAAQIREALFGTTTQ